MPHMRKCMKHGGVRCALARRSCGNIMAHNGAHIGLSVLRMRSRCLRRAAYDKAVEISISSLPARRVSMPCCTSYLFSISKHGSFSAALPSNICALLFCFHRLKCRNALQSYSTQTTGIGK